MGPIDYSINVESPFKAAVQGYQVGSAIREDQLKAEQMQAAQAQAQAQAMQLAQAREAAFQSPTAANFARLMTLDPKASEAYQRAWTARNTDQQQALASDLLQWGAAIKSGKPQIAADQLNSRAAMIEQQNGGAPTQESQVMRMQARLAIEQPEFALGQIQALLASNPLGKDAAETLGKFGAEARAAAQAPSALRKSEADATAAEAEAKTKGVAAKYAEQAAQADIDQKVATLGLTKAQAAQARALTSKYDAETKTALKSLEQVGKPTDQQRFDAETKLRSEYNSGTKGYVDVTEAYRRLKGSNNDAAGDLSLIFSYMKMLDPGSVVREGEFATAQNAAGVPERILNVYNRIASGERLTPGQRKLFTGQAESLYNAAQKREGEVRSGITKVARNYGLNSENIFGGRADEAGAATPNPQRQPLDSFDGRAANGRL